MARRFGYGAAALSLAMLLSVPAPAHSQTSELQVGAFPIAPFVMEQNGALIGFCMDIWSAVAARLKLKTNYHVVADPTALMELMVP